MVLPVAPRGLRHGRRRGRRARDAERRRRGDDNAAVELVEEGVNGFVAPSADPDDLAAAILACHDGGAALRDSTAAWFARRAPELTVDDSARAVDEWYSQPI